MSPITVCAVLVTYYPNKKLLKEVIDALVGQVSRIVIVDNTGPDQNHLVDQKNLDLVHIIKLECNQGVAAAQNMGIQWAKVNACSHVLLLDQDSVPDRQMTFYLSQALLTLERKGKRTAAVGPLCYHRGYNSLEPFLVRRSFAMERVHIKPAAHIVPVELLIASGSLISLNTFYRVGGLEESLFIDHIDTEWGFRARSKGYRCYVACQARLDHHLGEVTHRKLFGHNYKIVRHAPERYYYQFRNALLLFKKPYVPVFWITYQIFRQMIPRFILQATMIAPRKQNLIMMLNGLRHGFLNITGAYCLNSVRHSRVSPK